MEGKAVTSEQLAGEYAARFMVGLHTDRVHLPPTARTGWYANLGGNASPPGLWARAGWLAYQAVLAWHDRPRVTGCDLNPRTWRVVHRECR